MRLLRAGRFFAFASALLALSAATTLRPMDRLDAALRAGQAALQKGDAKGALPQIERAVSIAPEHPDFLGLLARAQIEAGRKDAALRTLERIDMLGATLAPESEARFSSLAGNPRFEAIRARFAERRTPRAASTPAFTIDDPDFVPEGIAYDAVADRFYVGSIRQRRIVEIDREGRSRDLVGAAQDGLFSVLGLAVHPERRLLYAASEVDGPTMQGFTKELEGASGLFVFELPNGRLKAKAILKDGRKHLFNDVAVTRDGDAYVTDSAEGSVHRFDAATGTLRRLIGPDRFLYPNGIALSPDERTLFVAHVTGIDAIDVRRATAKPLPHAPGITLAGIDGLTLHEGRLVGVQNGLRVPRIAAFQLDAAVRRVVSQEVLAWHDPRLTLPTTVAFAKDGYYLIADTPLGAFDDEGKRRPDAPTGPVHVVKIAR